MVECGEGLARCCLILIHQQHELDGLLEVRRKELELATLLDTERSAVARPVDAHVHAAAVATRDLCAHGIEVTARPEDNLIIVRALEIQVADDPVAGLNAAERCGDEGVAEDVARDHVLVVALVRLLIDADGLGVESDRATQTRDPHGRTFAVEVGGELDQERRLLLRIGSPAVQTAQQARRVLFCPIHHPAPRHPNASALSRTAPLALPVVIVAKRTRGTDYAKAIPISTTCSMQTGSGASVD